MLVPPADLTPSAELDVRSTDEVLRDQLVDVLQRLVDGSDLLALELDCPMVTGATMTVSRRHAGATGSLAVRGFGVPGADLLTRGTLWVSAAAGVDLTQARSWTLLLGALLDSELALQRAEAATRGALEIAHRDPATGLGNRRAWEHALRTEVARSQRSGQPLTLLVLDVDGLKAVNDVHGHAAGDALLDRAARALDALRRATDVVCRLGGDEFGIAAPDTDDVQSRLLASRVRRSLQEAGVRVSLGCAVSSAGFDADDLWREADAAMYEDKRARRPSWPLLRAEAEQASRDGAARMPRP